MSISLQPANPLMMRPVVPPRIFHWVLFVVGGIHILLGMACLLLLKVRSLLDWDDFWANLSVIMIVGAIPIAAGFIQRRHWQRKLTILRDYDVRMASLFDKR